MNPWGLWMHVEEAAPESASWLSYRPGRWGLRSDCTSGPGGLSCPVCPQVAWEVRGLHEGIEV